MGCKSLAEKLEVGEEEAQLFVNTLHATYPINQCRTNGFVVTLLGRRRFLPAINSNNAVQRAQAERQYSKFQLRIIRRKQDSSYI
ncbi:hypothetical protein OUZ56_017710 [Daphnia magna]|uniref:DNA-directed DNA polymerase family A palm domain-containing protein n=1 Tax=Daphnia magna TaxID=35525 RepID=A0ABR0ATH6_9CRUS|nr:hypothetical protein OUZ56_017710 [Daphnia magna]